MQSAYQKVHRLLKRANVLVKWGQHVRRDVSYCSLSKFSFTGHVLTRRPWDRPQHTRRDVEAIITKSEQLETCPCLVSSCRCLLAKPMTLTTDWRFSQLTQWNYLMTRSHLHHSYAIFDGRNVVNDVCDQNWFAGYKLTSSGTKVPEVLGNEFWTRMECFMNTIQSLQELVAYWTEWMVSYRKRNDYMSSWQQRYGNNRVPIMAEMGGRTEVVRKHVPCYWHEYIMYPTNLLRAAYSSSWWWRQYAPL
jgi:hypothetical protein